MFAQENPKQPSSGETIIIAVVIATVTAITTGLVGWGLQELKDKFGSKPQEKEESDDT